MDSTLYWLPRNTTLWKSIPKIFACSFVRATTSSCSHIRATDVARAHAWHNHQYAQLIVGMPLGRCDAGGRADGRAERRFEAPADLRRGVAIEAVCPAGADAFRERVREILDARGLFVGVLELFDASLLAMQRELGYASV